MGSWSELDRQRLKTFWLSRSLFELSEMFDHSERSVSIEAAALGLDLDDYATALARNDSETIHYCILLLRDNDWTCYQIGEKLQMPSKDVKAVDGYLKRELFYARLGTRRRHSVR